MTTYSELKNKGYTDKQIEEQIIKKYGIDSDIYRQFVNKYGTYQDWSKNKEYPTGFIPKFSDPNNQAYFNNLSDTDKKKFYDEFQKNINAGGSSDPAKTFEETKRTFASDTFNDLSKSFEEGYSGYVGASKDVYNLTTERQLEQYNRQKQDLETNYNTSITNLDWQKQKLDTDISRNREDYNKFVGRNQQDFHREVASANKDFANKLSQASSAYGKRGILSSGIQKTQTTDVTGQYVGDMNYFKTLNQRKLDDARLGLDRAEYDYSTGVNQINTQKQRATDAYNLGLSRHSQDISNYQSDRSAGLKSLEYQLQGAGDTLFNTTMANIQEIKRKQEEQDAINRTYGTKSSPIAPIYRIGGKYTIKS